MTDRWGIDPVYTDVHGEEHRVPEATVEALRSVMGDPAGEGPLFVTPGRKRRVGSATVLLEDGAVIEVEEVLPPDLPLGYHRLLRNDGEVSLVVAPERCHLPPGSTWGWAAQLYAARSGGSWGMGDFADLALLAARSRELGAGMLLVNPLAAVAPVLPIQPSPYFPTSRRFLNPLYLRVEEVPGRELAAPAVERAAGGGRALNRSRVIDRDLVWRLKLGALESIWEAGPGSGGFEEWVRGQGRPLLEFAAWSVAAERHGGDWRRWPAELAGPRAPGVPRLVEEAGSRVRFHQWLQWLCRIQLDRAAAPIMLIQDLPIGFDPGGADAWAWQEMLAQGVTVGAPPDEFNTRGQDWGLPPFLPHRLRALDYRPFIETIRAGLTGGGGLRIDHVMGLFRQFWIPAGAGPEDGAYVRFPHRDLLDIVALESARSGAVVVGEDLGTVGEGVREELAERGVLSYRLLWFEAEEPERWPELSMASVTTHDLPTVAGLWTGTDLREQIELGLSPNLDSTEAIRARIGARLGEPASIEEVVVAVHRLLGRAPSRLLAATLDDLAVSERRPNIPGADEDRPNWGLALPKTVEELTTGSLASRLAEVLGRGGPEMERDGET